MNPTRHLKPLHLYFIILAMLGAVFAADAATPLGIAVWIFYLAPVIVCLLSSDRYTPFYVAASASVLLLIGYFISPNVTLTNGWNPAINRVMGALTAWSLAFVAHLYITSSATLRRLAWIQQGRMLFSQDMQGELTARDIAGKVLGTMSKYLDAKVGALYVLEGQVLRRAGAWALPEDNAAPATVRVGEGLLGQVVADRKAAVVDNLPAGYLKVGSALGEATPSRVLIAPLTADGRVVGAVELGFMSAKLDLNDELEVVESSAESIGAALRSAVYRTRQEELLEETQRQSEELQVQQEELRVSNEELEERSRALMDSQARLETQQAELEQTNVQLEEHTQSLERQKRHLIEAQKRLAENAETLERANQYKSEFLANMSHELRTPLNSSLILSKLLADNKDGNLTSEQVRYASTIYSSNTDLLVLINDILDLSKVEAGHIEITPEPIALRTVLSSLQQSFQPVATQKKVGLRIEQAENAPEVLVTDNQRLQQILKNLLSNAFKFTDAGEVMLRASAVDADNVRFDVIDTGIGIPAAQQEVIFEAFRQADGTTSRKYGGSGLGLSISREFAHLLGGEITVTSTPGEGSTFSLTVAIRAEASNPAEPKAASAAPSAPASSPAPSARARTTTTSSVGVHTPASQPRPITKASEPLPVVMAPEDIADDRNNLTRGSRLILVIEDDPDFARILYDLAHELDFDCVHANTAAEGIRLAQTLRPSGILLDMGLPDNSGLLVLERLKRDSATRHLPIHVVSVADHTETALLLGAIGYTFKPSARDELAQAILSLEAKLRQRMRRILVVEDDPALRENIQLLLQTQDVELEGVGTVADALERLRTRTYDCMVMDLVLPDGSGYDLLEKVGDNPEHSFPPVIVYTGRSLTSDEEQRLRRYSKSIIIKGARSPERLLDEVTLFLHSVESDLPVEQQRMLKEARKRDSAFEGRRILLAEDDVRNIFALSQVIEPLGAHLEIARNGREALNVLARHPHIDLVLMDIMMPEMDGIAAMQEIRKRSEFKKLPIIALTAKAMPADRQRCLDAGANDYISKPLDVDKLLSLCRVWLPQ
jgi:CheY-like chemotaxis protein